jgi:hypothetical protein
VKDFPFTTTAIAAAWLAIAFFRKTQGGFMFIKLEGTGNNWKGRSRRSACGKLCCVIRVRQIGHFDNHPLISDIFDSRPDK